VIDEPCIRVKVNHGSSMFLRASRAEISLQAVLAGPSLQNVGMESPPSTEDADVLGQPTRARLLDPLYGLDRPATSEELAAHVSRHRTGVRVHLERLEAAGPVERRRVRQARGRPRDAWSTSPRAPRARGRPDAYAEFAAGWRVRSRPGPRGCTRSRPPGADSGVGRRQANPISRAV
jgi:hypothetical protein